MILFLSFSQDFIDSRYTHGYGMNSQAGHQLKHFHNFIRRRAQVQGFLNVQFHTAGIQRGGGGIHGNIYQLPRPGVQRAVCGRGHVIHIALEHFRVQLSIS